MDIWSRRKAGVAAEAAAEEKAVEQADIAEAQAELEEKTDAEILAELDLPDPDQMKMGDDFTGFMKAVVPERIRKRALRKLWLSNPVLANVDNLLDYGEDFTGEGVLGETIATSYQVGKGLLAHVKEMERQAEAEAAVVEEIDGDGDGDDIEDEIELVAEIAPEDVAAPVAPVEITHDDETDEFTEEMPAVKRKMRFQFAS